MSTTTAPAPATATVEAATVAAATNVALTKSVGVYVKALGKLDSARDGLFATAQTETTRHGWNEKQLRANLTLAGLNDERTISECVKIVFPANAENTAQLQRIAEHNSAQSDAKLRISKPVQMMVARSKEPITVEAAQAAVAAKAAEKGTRKANPPGGTEHRETDPAKRGDTATAPAKLTPKEQEEKIFTALSAAASLAKGYGYSRLDFEQTLDAWGAEYLTALLPAEETETPTAQQPNG